MRDIDGKVTVAFFVVWAIMAVVAIIVTGVAVWIGIELAQWVTNGGLTAAVHGKS